MHHICSDYSWYLILHVPKPLRSKSKHRQCKFHFPWNRLFNHGLSKDHSPKIDSFYLSLIAFWDRVIPIEPALCLWGCRGSSFKLWSTWRPWGWGACRGHPLELWPSCLQCRHRLCLEFLVLLFLGAWVLLFHGVFHCRIYRVVL